MFIITLHINHAGIAGYCFSHVCPFVCVLVCPSVQQHTNAWSWWQCTGFMLLRIPV